MSNESTSTSRRYINTSERGLTQEFSFPVPWGQVCGKTWGDVKNPPIICLHGWLDNCNTFDKLIPLLPKNHYYIACDFPGHGTSSHLLKGMCYTELMSGVTLKRLIDYFRLEEVTMIGHSMGGSIALYFAGLYPDIVKRVVAIDSFGIYTTLKENLTEGLRQWIETNIRFDDAEPRHEKQYNYDEAKEKLQNAGSVLDDEAACILLERSSKELDNGKRIFTRDVKNYSLMPVQRTHLSSIAYIENIKADVLIVGGKTGVYGMAASLYGEKLDMMHDKFKESCRSFKMVHVEGNHYLHLCAPEATAKEINKFLQENPTVSQLQSKL